MKIVTGWISILALCAVIYIGSARAEEVEVNQSYALRQDGVITIENITGDIQVTTWDKPEVKLKAIKRAKTTSELEALEIAIKSKPGSISIETKSHERIRGGHQEYTTPTVEYVLQAPANARLKTVRTINGNIRIEGHHAVETLKTVNGSIRVNYAPSSTKLFRSGSFSTTNGSIEVAVPNDANLTINAANMHGGISSNIPGVQVERSATRASAQGKLGSGGPVLNLKSTNGRIGVTAL